MKIKNIKAKPLLEPPTEKEWWEVTGRDRADIEKLLSGFGKDGVLWIDANLPVWAKRLGLLNESDGSLKRILEAYERERKKTVGRTAEGVGAVLYNMKRMGFEPKMTQKEREYLYSELEGIRHSDNGYVYSFILKFMKGLGLDVEITERDKKYMKKDVESLRESPQGDALAHMHLNMRELGFQTKVTAEDKEIFRKTLEWSRANSDEDHRTYLLFMHYAVRELGMVETPPKEAPLPPLKWFGK